TAYFWRIFGPLESLIQLNVTIQTASASIERIFNFLEEPIKITSQPKALRKFKVSGNIEFRDVDFSYNSNEKILKGISLKIEPGQTVALIGPSGSGKTTLAHLLIRFYDPISGSILIDGRKIKDLDLKAYRRQIGLVSQDPFLFNTTIEENIRFGKKDADLTEIEEAARLAQILDFISDLPQKFQTRVGDRGEKLSGGQRQRISLARTFLKNPKVLILDEATSSVDQKKEKMILSSLKEHFGDRTIIMVSHRPTMLQIADRVLHLNHGFINEMDKEKVISESKDSINYLRVRDHEKIKVN
ncbi:MAG: ABC transporter ATP-binding protein, partial [Candidatus Zixiibacteriota bacterium]